MLARLLLFNSNYFSLTKARQPQKNKNKFSTLVHAFTENGTQGYNNIIIIIIHHHHYYYYYILAHLTLNFFSAQKNLHALVSIFSKNFWIWSNP